MQNRNPWPMWISVSVFLTGAVTIPIAYRSQYPQSAPPHSLREFKERLSQAEPKLHIVPAAPLCPERGILVSERPLSPDQTNRLFLSLEYASRWQGIALCEIPLQPFCILEEVQESWGEHGMQIGPILCFGDPALLRRMHKAIFDQERAE